MWDNFLHEIKQGDFKALARCISLIENDADGYEKFLQQLNFDNSSRIIGITGPPGAGKSTLTDALIGELINEGKTVGVLCIDPSSPFNFGALLGDRIRMNEWYSHPNVFIRSLASRGALGGLHSKIIEITDVMKVAGFDYIFIETVGVGQSEVDIAGIADATVVVLVPEGGDIIQTMKAGIMEIADIFVINKSDRPEADVFVKNVQMMNNPASEIPIIKTVASEKLGINELFLAIKKQLKKTETSDRKYFYLTERAYYIIQKRRMQDVIKKDVFELIKKNKVTNLYSFIQQYLNRHTGNAK